MTSVFSTRLRQCPVCKKTDPLAGDSATAACPRCGCDLTKPAAAHAAACHHAVTAAAMLRARDYDEALEHAGYAWSLAELPVIPPLACLAATLSRRLPELALWRARCGHG